MCNCYYTQGPLLLSIAICSIYMTPNTLQGPIDAMRFAVDFVQMDLEQASQSELKAAHLCVRKLISLTMEHPDRHDWAGKGWGRVLTRAELQRLHADARSLLTGIVVSGDAEAALQLEFSVARAPLRNLSSAARTVYHPAVWIVVNGSPRDRFLYRVIRLLDELGADKLHMCPTPECGRLFFKVTRKEFCSARCQSRVYMRRYREQPGSTKKKERLRVKTRTK